MISKNSQLGQTLIETLVGALVLVMGISAAVGLAIYGLSATTGVTKQLIAVGLAREGMEAVKNIRDSNWLSTAKSPTCYDFYTNSNIATCYPNWLIGQNIAGTRLDDGTYYLNYNATPINGSYWTLTPVTSIKKYALDYDASDPTQGLYRAFGQTTGNSGFSRKITLTQENGFAPFDKVGLGPRLKVNVDVWWEDKRCPHSDDVTTTSSCKISLETYLTNWKNY